MQLGSRKTRGEKWKTVSIDNYFRKFLWAYVMKKKRKAVNLEIAVGAKIIFNFLDVRINGKCIC